jgi:hypothetical protein
VNEYGLVGIAAEVCTALLARYPLTVITSGRRDIVAQANAMATNIGQAGAAWIAATYAPSYTRGACILAVHGLTTPLTHDGVAHAIHSVLSTMTDAQLAQLSRHLGGGAFDCSPQSMTGDSTAWLDHQCRTRGGKLLTCEGGLVKCHAEFPIP